MTEEKKEPFAEDDLNLFTVVPADCSSLEVLAKGKRGVVFKALWKGKFVAIKTKRPDSEASNVLLLEAEYLKKANKLGVGPKLFEVQEEYVVMDFVVGTPIGEFLEDPVHPQKILLAVIKDIFDQLYKLDAAGINKFELTNPYKHIIVTPDYKTVMIDFERARHSQRPKNMSQFAQYLLSSKILFLLQSKGILNDVEKFKVALKIYQQEGKKFSTDVLV